MSDYRRFIAYLYEYPNNRKGGCCGFVRVESQNGFCRMDFQIKSPSLPPETSVTVYGFIRRSGRMYGIPLGNLLAGRSSTSGKLFTHSDAIGQTDVTLDELGGLILLCRQTGVIATQWDDLPIQPEFFAPTLPQEPKTSADNGARPTEEKTAETPEPLDPAVPAQSLPSSDASKAQFDELSTEFSSNSELYPQNSSPESTVSTESTSTDTVNTVPADRITQSSANTLHPASAESVKTAESYPSVNPELPQPIPDSAAQPLHMTSADFPAAAAVPPSRAALYLQLQDQFPEFHPFPDDDLTDCLRLSLDDLPQLRAAGLSVDANRFVLHGSSSYRHLLLARNRAVHGKPLRLFPLQAGDAPLRARARCPLRLLVPHALKRFLIHAADLHRLNLSAQDLAEPLELLPRIPREPRINHIIRFQHHVFVMLDHDNRVARIAQLFQRVDQTNVIPLVQPYTRFIQDI